MDFFFFKWDNRILQKVGLEKEKKCHSCNVCNRHIHTRSGQNYYAIDYYICLSVSLSFYFLYFFNVSWQNINQLLDTWKNCGTNFHDITYRRIITFFVFFSIFLFKMFCIYFTKSLAFFSIFRLSHIYICICLSVCVFVCVDIQIFIYIYI